MITLDTEELLLVHTNNTDKNRLIFAVMLKFFQMRGRFPTKKDAIEHLLLFIDALQREINRRWSTINLIDILKEADFRVGFTKQFHSVGNREILDGKLLQKRLLLCLP